MSTAKTKMSLLRAQQLAAALIADLEPGCDRIEVAGSIRRRRPEVGDLEIVAIPKPRLNLLGEPDGTHLDGILEGLQKRGQLTRIKGGDKYKQFAVAAPACCHIDLFLTTADQWGLILLIRTGPESFSRQVVTQKSKGGLLPDDLRVSNGRLWRGDEILPTLEESDVFRAAGLAWLEPWKRT